MVDAVSCSDVAEEGVPEPFAFGGSWDQSIIISIKWLPRDIDDAEDSLDFTLGLEHLAKSCESLVGNWHFGDIGVDGAERVIFGRHIELAEQIECG